MPVMVIFNEVGWRETNIALSDRVERLFWGQRELLLEWQLGEVAQVVFLVKSLQGPQAWDSGRVHAMPTKWKNTYFSVIFALWLTVPPLKLELLENIPQCGWIRKCWHELLWGNRFTAFWKIAGQIVSMDRPIPQKKHEVLFKPFCLWTWSWLVSVGFLHQFKMYHAKYPSPVGQPINTHLSHAHLQLCSRSISLPMSVLHHGPQFEHLTHASFGRFMRAACIPGDIQNNQHPCSFCVALGLMSRLVFKTTQSYFSC